MQLKNEEYLQIGTITHKISALYVWLVSALSHLTV